MPDSLKNKLNKKHKIDQLDEIDSIIDDFMSVTEYTDDYIHEQEPHAIYKNICYFFSFLDWTSYFS